MCVGDIFVCVFAVYKPVPWLIPGYMSAMLQKCKILTGRYAPFVLSR